MNEKTQLVLLPGLLCDARLWEPAVKPLSGIAEWQVADLTRSDSIAAMARDVLAKAPEKFALAGLSMGGYVAFEITRQAPERVAKLCLLDTSARPDTPEQKERRRLLLVMSRSGKFKGVTPRLLPMLIHPERMKDVVLTGAVMAMAESIGREAFQRQQTAIMNRIDSRPSLGAIECPVQVVGGRQDALTPPEILQEIASGVAGAKLTVIEDCGHLSPLEKPEQVANLLRNWLAG